MNAQQQQDRIATQTIDDLDRAYCDEFECTSSPAIEQTVRSLARDLTKLRVNSSLCQRDVTYSDGFLSFTGIQRMAQPRWYAENFDKPTVTITKMRMLDKGTAEIQWRAEGRVGSAPTAFSATSTITLNQVTGRIATYKEAWDLSGLSPPAVAALTLSRALWSLKEMAKDAAQAVKKGVDSSLSSMDGDGPGNGPYNPNPSDPTRFFLGSQDPGKQQWNDMVSFATLTAFLYLIFRAFGELEKL